jgi:hypothetical protein
MRKFMNRVDLQIRLHLAIRHLLTIIIHNYGTISSNIRLEEWYKLSWEEFLDELKSSGISVSNETDTLHLKETFEQQKGKVVSIQDEINRHDEIVKNRVQI